MQGLAVGRVARQHEWMLALKRYFAPLNPVLDQIFPPRCPLCGAGLASQSGLCGTCWDTLVIPTDPCCTRCQRPFPDHVMHGAVCAPCLAHPPVHDGIAAATLYNDAARRLVLTFKHGGKITLAQMMARLIAARLPVLEGEWLIVPVPLHPWRLWWRGFNQAGLLARHLARLKGQRLMVDGLIRRKHTQKMGTLGAKTRERILRGAIVANARRADQLAGARIVLVDDVLTSGATSRACVKALKAAGAERVILACFSRVLDEALDTQRAQAQDGHAHKRKRPGSEPGRSRDE